MPDIQVDTGAGAPYDREDFGFSPEQLGDKYNPTGGGEHPCYTRNDWMWAVANRDTISGYWLWLARQIADDAGDHA